jgi:4-hydroxy-2-oxoglutarate aldolase
MLLEGLHIPLTTPFHTDGRLNAPKLVSNIARYSKTPAAGLIVLSPTGESTLLTDDETREAMRAAAQAASPDKVLIAGPARDSVRGALALADFAAEQRYDAVLIGVPSILATHEGQSIQRLREILIFFQTIADRSPLPVVLLSSTGANGRRIAADAAVELAAHPNIIGLMDAATQPTQSSEVAAILQRTAAIKRNVTVTPTFTAVTARMLAAASGRAPASLISAATLTGISSASAAAIAEPPPTSAPPALRTRTKSVGFQILAGASASMLEGLRAGASGIAPAFAACAPQACYEVFAAWKDDDQPLAEEKQARLNAAAHLAQEMLGPGGLKFGCDLNGYFGGWPRLPHLPPTGEQRAALERLMEGIRN